MTDKLKQYIALFGGLLSAVLLFLQSLGFTFTWFTDSTIDAFINALFAAVPFILIVYGVYKNSYIVTKQAKEQEELLKQKGLK
ncbi:PTS mannose transporter subunit IID [Viridibacillus sp. FSL H7-0596]|uniref:phage holin n=1 Tax=Viridibacillus sp. FSL H7-0596 TaxID=1928923 RepID=UPI00096E801D|nr:phage holin [Viridibacillus sp. FSL H7-0596]OMC86939.1 PTS mannose transporter subunit IID [Viridibacillus sp. FSL H7-0596]